MISKRKNIKRKIEKIEKNMNMMKEDINQSTKEGIMIIKIISQMIKLILV